MHPHYSGFSFNLKDFPYSEVQYHISNLCSMFAGDILERSEDYYEFYGVLFDCTVVLFWQAVLCFRIYFLKLGLVFERKICHHVSIAYFLYACDYLLVGLGR